jgi:hypothetical protein
MLAVESFLRGGVARFSLVGRGLISIDVAIRASGAAEKSNPKRYLAKDLPGYIEAIGARAL